jgi:hypothetical protein
MMQRILFFILNQSHDVGTQFRTSPFSASGTSILSAQIVHLLLPDWNSEVTCDLELALSFEMF